MLRPFILVTKPGIIAGNLIAALGGFFLAAKGDISYLLLLQMVLGIGLVIASGCVFNNYIDRDIDALMERTRDRTLVKGLMKPKTALIYASVLGLMGFSLLWFINPLTWGLALLGFVVYVGFYSLWLKRRSVYGTLVGSISGAVPPAIGYCAVTGQFDSAAFLLMLIFCIWQMPHSYAIAIFRYRDYQKAGIPVLPVLRGISMAKYHICNYVFAFALTTLLLTLAGHAGSYYLGAVIIVGMIWMALALRGFSIEDDILWAKHVFAFSIVAIMVLSVMISVDFQPPVVDANQVMAFLTPHF